MARPIILLIFRQLDNTTILTINFCNLPVNKQSIASLLNGLSRLLVIFLVYCFLKVYDGLFINADLLHKLLLSIGFLLFFS